MDQAIMEPTGVTRKSLTGSETLYRVVQIRRVGVTQIRVQCAGLETAFECSSDLTAWLTTCEASRSSLAGSAAKYVPALARIEATDDPAHVRFQVIGPKLNREWGAVFVAYAPSVVQYLKKVTG